MTVWKCMRLFYAERWLIDLCPVHLIMRNDIAIWHVLVHPHSSARHDRIARKYSQPRQRRKLTRPVAPSADRQRVRAVWIEQPHIRAAEVGNRNAAVTQLQRVRNAPE